MLQLSDLPAIEEVLLREGLLILRKGRPLLTNKFYDLYGATAPELVAAQPKLAKDRFKDFIRACEVMEAIFRSDLEQCSHLAPRDWRARGLHRRFTEAVLNPLRHLL